MRILITNDDGIDSPLLHSLVDAVSVQPWVTSCDVVIPFSEQSWVSNSISRNGVRYIRDRNFNDREYKLVNGTPADCVSLSCSGLLDFIPDLVLSGINFGINAGTCFFYTSGTIAGARQAALFNVPAIALSASLKSEVFNFWSERNYTGLLNYSTYFNELAFVSVKLIKSLLDQNIFDISNDIKVDFISINTPEEIKNDEPVVTTLEKTRFKPLFHEIENSKYIHSFKGFNYFEETGKFSSNNENLKTDINVLNQGGISVSLFSVDSV